MSVTERSSADDSAGWVLNLRRLLAGVHAEAGALSERARGALHEALNVLQAALPTRGVGVGPPGPDAATGPADSPLPAALRTLLVGAAPQRLEALLTGLCEDDRLPAVTFVRDLDAATRALDRERFDLIVCEHTTPDPAPVQALSRLHALPGCPPIILIAGCGNELVATTAFKAGVYDYLPESGLTAHTFRLSVLQALRRRGLETELEAAHTRLAELVYRDPLTGLFNRRYFENRLAVEFARAHRFGEPLALILLDIDHFKVINDRFGHLTGDRVLVDTGRSLQSLLRQIDLVARIGGDEFALLLPNTAASGGLALAARVVDGVRGMRVDANGRAVQLTVSAGVTAYPECDAGTRIELFESADRALYRAKAEGRDRISEHRSHTPS